MFYYFRSYVSLLLFFSPYALYIYCNHVRFMSSPSITVKCHARSYALHHFSRQKIFQTITLRWRKGFWILFSQHSVLSHNFLLEWRDWFSLFCYYPDTLSSKPFHFRVNSILAELVIKTFENFECCQTIISYTYLGKEVNLFGCPVIPGIKTPEVYLLVFFGILSLFLASRSLPSTTIISLFDAFFLFALVSFSTLLMLVRVVKAEQLFCRLINVEQTVFIVLLLIVRRYKFI